jgi:hypothetical protein
MYGVEKLFKTLKGFKQLFYTAVLNFLRRILKIFFDWPDRFMLPSENSTFGWHRNWVSVRILTFLYVSYKLMSKDFSIFGFAPSKILSIYPHEVYPWEGGLCLLGVPWVVDLASFHWIHWLVPFPNIQGLEIIQHVAILLCLLVVFFGKGPKHLFPILAFICISYLWGFVWRSGSELDDIFIALQVILLYCLFKEKDALVLQPNRESVYKKSKENGWFYSMVILVFCTYYFYAGINKLTDINFLQWVEYDLAGMIGVASAMYHHGYHIEVLAPLQFLKDLPIINYTLVPLIYIAELLIPLMFFYRKWIPLFILIFTTFHLTTWAVGILFFGNFVMWLTLIPLESLFERKINPVEMESLSR